MEETLKILVVDDDEVDRMAVRRALTKAGITVEFFESTSCTDAIAALQNTTFDCVFLDYRLPDQDGIVLIQKVRSAEIKVPLVVLTGQGDEEIAVELMKSGATDYLAKSKVSSETLAQVLRQAIRVYRAEMQVAEAYQQLKDNNELLKRQNQELEAQRQQIQLQNIKLIEAGRLKSQFLATISHELRTPMNAIVGFSQVLLRPTVGTLTQQQRDMVERIFNNAKQLLMLVNEVLDFSHMEAGKLNLKPQVFDLSKVINATVAELRSLAEAKKLSLLVQVDLQNTLIFNDPVRVQQIVTNLLSNAIKFTDSGSIWVEIEDVATDRVTVIVRDTGIGMTPDNIEKIFDAFWQIDQSITRKYPGTGLGLAITDALVKMMDGTITVESKINNGSVFKVDIPRRVSSINCQRTDEKAKGNIINLFQKSL